MSSELRVGRVFHGTTAEGPGKRTAVWVQGCTIRCPGCINPELFDARGGRLIAVRDLLAEALAEDVEGFTFLGGEPFEQAGALGELAELARAEGLGVIAFTGHRHEDLAARPDAQRLLEHTDLLVDGEYQAANPETERSLVGSANQRFLHFTDRYRGVLPAPQRNRVELRIGPDGSIEMAGFLTSEGLGAWAGALESRRRPRQRKRSGGAVES
ncbi:MAG: radical SAM protein [Arthrobacter sp.]|nr:radical SAM protein [Arthrobacter sp.]